MSLLLLGCGGTASGGEDGGPDVLEAGAAADAGSSAVDASEGPDARGPDAGRRDAGIPGPRAEYLDVIQCPQSVPACLLSFGRVPLDATERQTITLLNTWPAPLTVSRIALDRVEFTLHSRTSTVLSSMGTAVVEVEYHPTAPGVHRAILTIYSDATRNPVQEVPVEGGTDATTPCAGDRECLYQESCDAMSCASCSLPTPPPCFEGSLAGDSYGNGCNWPYCRCQSGSYYSAGHCIAAASCAQGQACGAGQACNLQLSCAFPAQYCPDPAGFCQAL
ncbi:MAG: hypothetical protein U1E65_20460 [Myxococcota bacterium]